MMTPTKPNNLGAAGVWLVLSRECWPKMAPSILNQKRLCFLGHLFSSLILTDQLVLSMVIHMAGQWLWLVVNLL